MIETEKGILDSPIYRSSGGRYISRREIDIVLQYLKPGRAMRILDLGCGSGRISRALINTRAQVVGLEADIAQMKQTAQDFKTLGCAGFYPVIANGQFLPFKRASFDAVVCFRVLKYIPEYELTIREMHRVLKPHGRLILEISNLYSWEILINRLKPKKAGPAVLHYFTLNRMVKLLKRNGFKVVASAPTYKIPFAFWTCSRSALMLSGLNLLHRFLLKATPKGFLSRGIVLNCVRER
jgi:ubiquinone/menaquinone biosynthesis C-methylase UbiE